MSNNSNKEEGKKPLYSKKAGERMFAGANDTLFKRAAELRSYQTHAEEILWNYLRTKPYGFKFRRQHPFLNYVLDFYCHSLKLVIEVDGRIHQKEKSEEVISQLENYLTAKAKLKIEKPHKPRSPL
jgi:very-short-patch-repair endonuclease